MRKKCYHCELIKDGSHIESGRFICYNCQCEADEVMKEDFADIEVRYGSQAVAELIETEANNLE